MNVIARHPGRLGPPLRRPHAVVIGSGFGGLAAAVRLGARGWRVTVLERLDQPGGRARVHRQDGFAFDAGPTIVTAPQLFEELWALCGQRMRDHVPLVPLPVFYRIRFDDGSTFAAHAEHAAMRAEVARLSPADLPGFDRLMALSAKLCRTGFEELGHRPFTSLARMARVVPDMLRLGAWRSVHALVARHLKDERLRIAFSFHPLLIGGNPFAASGIYALIPHLEQRWGVHWPIGGTGALAEGLARLVEGQGNRLRLGAEVARILVRDGRAAGVELKDGERIAADIVVSNACAAFTYGRLLADVPRRRWSDARLSRARHSMGLFVWYFGTRRRYEAVDHHTILLGPRYRGLLEDVFDRGIVPHDPSLYLHRPTATEPGIAPPGHDAFYVLAPVPHLGHGTDWVREAEPFRRLIAQRLHSTILPGFEREIVTSRVTTPADFRDDFLSVHGAGFGLEPRLLQSAWFRPHNASEDLPGLFLVGAGTHPGAGLPGVLSSARALDELVPAAHAHG